MRVLALNPFHGGSHRAFLDGWTEHSSHDFETLWLPGRKWKWRMRHAPLEFARQLHSHNAADYDGIFTTDMLDLPTFRGLCPEFSQLPVVVYFHENQLTYPSRASDAEKTRDMHFAFTNVLTAASADAAWFNSEWHRRSFIDATRKWVSRMPDYPPKGLADQIEARSIVQYPGVDLIGVEDVESNRPMQIVWVSRWEHDKNPETFFEALRHLKTNDVAFELNVLGERYRECPPCFASAEIEFADHIRHWGFAESRDSYRQILRQSDVVVSTAVHEFFGLAVVEAVSAGCTPLLPNALAYPEVFRDVRGIFHQNTAEDIASRLTKLARSTLWRCKRQIPAGSASRYAWPKVAASLDENILLTFDNR